MQTHVVTDADFTVGDDGSLITEASTLFGPGRMGWPDALNIDGVIATRQRTVWQGQGEDREIGAVVYRCPAHPRAVEVHVLND